MAVLAVAIAHVGSNPFVVVYEASAKEVVIADPGTGLQRVRRADFERIWKGFLLLLAPVPDDELAEREAREGVTFEKSVRQRERERPTGLSRFVPYLRPYRTLLIEVMLAAVALQLLGLAMPLVTQSVIDRVLVHTERGLLIGLIVAAIGAATFVAVIGSLRTLLLYDAVRGADRGLVLDFHRRLFRLPLRFFSLKPVPGRA